ncbi:hypothetical protein HPB51_029070 [Rhipicephalus microplus]|uniref:DUF4806 domain-containing protein n=1 Tax=Rhipicephalus microplus TaxID=6941 RepID=A0A9J6CV60_RHIMP|nr:hypothetical protein HPB51_029070 [Rhipicephalus microplus]
MRISQTILMRLEQLGRQVDAMQQHLFNTTVRLQDETNDDVVLTPVKDIDQFLSLEGRLAADGNIKLKLIQQLAGLGGSTFGAAARRMLELLLSLEVAVQFSWAGQKGKRKFVDLGVTDVICKAVRRNFPETKKNDIECVIKVWLRHAGEKLQKQRLRTSRTHHEDEQPDNPFIAELSIPGPSHMAYEELGEVQSLHKQLQFSDHPRAPSSKEGRFCVGGTTSGDYNDPAWRQLVFPAPVPKGAPAV